MKRRASQDERGFTLVEGLMASAILSTSILGLAALQGMALRQNVDANELTRANNVAADMIERIQFNRKNVGTYNNLQITSTTNNCPAQANLSPPNNTMTTRGDCLQWEALLAQSQLTGVKGFVVLNPTPPFPAGVVANFPTVAVANGLNQTAVLVQLTWTGTRLGSAQVLNLITVIAPE